ncbi:hypothetical protein D6850_11515 [Roseovarius spongiae]|uniref:N-acetylmuramoyl-L-alanine amidase n=1 Tax=Roseovarius spongiae TaxID=2320272 RepID=A0A3A8ARU9_9RHOB|nr:hypothetical protein [Roseovarius spongiae]RKF13822.1 hypothetical protein D6850_11515 [Roseovarius spongiae]
MTGNFRTILGGALLALALAGGAAVASEDCLAPGEVRDKDVARNAKLIGAQKGLCLSALDFEENGITWRVTVIDDSAQPDGPTIYLLHDNEDSAFDAGLYSVLKYGGRLIALESGESRTHQGQDPNRNFGMTKKATAACADMRVKPAPLFTQFLLDLRNPRIAFFLTLHNNADGHRGNGGSGGISAKRTSAVMTGMMSPKGNADEDDAVLLAGKQPYEKNRRAKMAAGFFLERGINVIYEHVRPERNDCSFSNYVVLNDLGEYYNIEAQHGHTAQQKAMLDSMMTFHRIGVRNNAIR